MVPWQDVLKGLPQELRDQVTSGIDDFPIDMEEAKQARLELMEERKYYISSIESSIENNQFSLCEH